MSSPSVVQDTIVGVEVDTELHLPTGDVTRVEDKLVSLEEVDADAIAVYE